MNIHFYNEEDLRAQPPMSIDGETYHFAFIGDVPGDNPDTLGDYDNHLLASRLERFGAVGKEDRLDCEACCFYIYFRTKSAGLLFVEKLNSYLNKKACLLREAMAF